MKPTETISIEDALKGVPFESARRTIAESDIVNFCGVSGDYSPAHADEAYMSGTEYGGRIAHGLLIMSAASSLADLARPFPADVSYGYENVRVLGAVKSGDTIRVRQTVKAIRPYPKREEKVLFDVLYEVLTVDDRLVCVSTHILLGPRPK